MTKTATYGTWQSPITAADVARGKVLLSFPAFAGDEVWWQESRPAEGGRVTVMTSGGEGSGARELLPAPWYARTRVHEYGGMAYLPVPAASAFGGFDLVFANFADQRLYVQTALGGAPRPLTPLAGGFRFADMVLSPDGGEIWCVRETVTDEGVSRAIVAVPLDGSAARRALRDPRPRNRGRLLRLPYPVAGRDQAGVDQLGPPADAVGRHGTARRRRAERGGWQRAGGRRRAGHGRPG